MLHHLVIFSFSVPDLIILCMDIAHSSNTPTRNPLYNTGTYLIQYVFHSNNFIIIKTNIKVTKTALLNAWVGMCVFLFFGVLTFEFW